MCTVSSAESARIRCSRSSKVRNCHSPIVRYVTLQYSNDRTSMMLLGSSGRSWPSWSSNVNRSERNSGTLCFEGGIVCRPNRSSSTVTATIPTLLRLGKADSRFQRSSVRCKRHRRSHSVFTSQNTHHTKFQSGSHCDLERRTKLGYTTGSGDLPPSEERIEMAKIEIKDRPATYTRQALPSSSLVPATA